MILLILVIATFPFLNVRWICSVKHTNSRMIDDSYGCMVVTGGTGSWLVVAHAPP